MKRNDEFFYSSWGYEQTNIDFYKVLKRTAATVTLVAVEADITQSGNMSYYAKPTNKVIGKPFRRKLTVDSNWTFVKVSSYEYAHPWDGIAKRGTSYA